MDDTYTVINSMIDEYGNSLTFTDEKSNNRRNWTPWIYFEGEIIGADQLGNINLAYAATKAGFPEKMYSNRVTRDDERDEYAIDWGIRLAKSGR